MQEDELKRKILRVDEVSSEAAGGSGDNYTSIVRRLQVDVMLESGKAHNMTLILKEAPTDGEDVAFFKDEGFMETELKMYKEILPKLKEVLSEAGEPALWPMFLGMKENYIILTDLKSKGYRTRNRKERLDLEHALLTVKGLAKIHAASVVLKERGKLDVSSLRPPLLVRNTPVIRKYRAGALKAASAAILDSWGPEWRDIGERLQNKCLFNDEVEKLAEVDETRLNVLCHGDPWTANIFFRYSLGSSPKPLAVRFVDFQLCLYNSYAFDIAYMLGTSVSAELRRNCLTQILECYTDALRQSLEAYQLQHLAPTLEMVQAELKRITPYFFFVLFIELPVGSSIIEDPLDLGKMMVGDDVPAHNPEIYKGSFKNEVDQELLQWAQEKWF